MSTLDQETCQFAFWLEKLHKSELFTVLNLAAKCTHLVRQEWSGNLNPHFLNKKRKKKTKTLFLR